MRLLWWMFSFFFGLNSFFLHNRFFRWLLSMHKVILFKFWRNRFLHSHHYLNIIFHFIIIQLFLFSCFPHSLKSSPATAYICFLYFNLIDFMTFFRSFTISRSWSLFSLFLLFIWLRNSFFIFDHSFFDLSLSHIRDSLQKDYKKSYKIHSIQNFWINIIHTKVFIFLKLLLILIIKIQTLACRLFNNQTIIWSKQLLNCLEILKTTSTPFFRRSICLRASKVMWRECWQFFITKSINWEQKGIFSESKWKKKIMNYGR